MRLRRSLFFVASATPAGRPSRPKPGETVQSLPGRDGCGLPGATKLPQPAFLTTWGCEVRAGHETRITAFTHRTRQASATKSWRSYRVLRPSGGEKCRLAAAPEVRSSCRKQPRRMRGRCQRTSFGPGAWMARHGRKSCVGMAVVFAVGAKGPQHQKPPPGPPNSPPSQCFTAHDCAALWGIVRNCAVWGGILFAPEQVSAHRQPFSVGHTKCTVSRSSCRPSGSFRCGERKMNPC